MLEPMMTVQEVADLLGVSIYTIHRLKEKPDGLQAYRVGRCIRFKRSEVEEYLARHAVEPVFYNSGKKKGSRFVYVTGMRVV
ncbi:MAG: helix-turn-helix domain-containing protein [Oscillibacter sp.]|nr:helix-turn-helix domain-containing protein [Oscillibacter sp.]